MNSDQLFAYIAQRATAINAAIEADLERVSDPDLEEVLRHALLAGGKRVRPVLVLAAAGLVGRRRSLPDSGLNALAVCVEYLHVASLLHDDVIDGAEQRRGRPAANTLWGSSRVILAGDYLHARAMTMAGTAGGAAAIAVLGRATSRMVEAEFLQHRVAATQSTALDDYFQVIDGKTAALIAASCEIGALAGGGTESECQALARYGTNLGLAFQIVDDLLDYLGDPDKTGKQVGNDFAEGKMTLPLLLAIERADENDRQRIRQLLDQPTSRKGFATMVEILDRLDGFENARRRAATLIDEAIAALSPFADGPEKDALTGLAHYVLNRQH